MNEYVSYSEGAKIPAWVTVERPGYEGKQKDAQIARLNKEFGEGNWRKRWELANGETFTYDDVFWKIYVPGYVKHFITHSEEAFYLSDNFSYAYDKDVVSKKDAFDPHALYNKPGRPNQFHNVALNIALEWYLGLPFRGTTPIQVREGKQGTPSDTWPQGWKWSPGRIATVRPDLIPASTIDGWWEKGTIEDLYQTAKLIQVRK